MPKYNVGQRVLYTSPPMGRWSFRFHVASMGNQAAVMHLNARDEQGRIKPITGTILKVIPQPDGSAAYDFAPDGWILPASGWPKGFQASEKDLAELNDPHLTLPGTLTDRNGRPL